MANYENQKTYLEIHSTPKQPVYFIYLFPCSDHVILFIALIGRSTIVIMQYSDHVPIDAP